MATETELYRIAWKHKDSGAIPVMGASKAANTGLVTDPLYADDLNGLFPELEFVQQVYLPGDGWVNAYVD